MNVSLYWDHQLPRLPADGSALRLPEWQTVFGRHAKRMMAGFGKPSNLSHRFWLVVAVSALLHALVWLFWQIPTLPTIEPRIMRSVEVALIAPQPEAAPPQARVAPPPPEVKPEPKPVPRPIKRPSTSQIAQPIREVPPQPTPAATAPPAPSLPFVEANYRAAYLNNPPPKYPMLAKERHWEGTVVLKVEVLTDGSSGNVLVDQSSGHDVLDDAAAEAARHWRFSPAKRGDDVVASWVLIPIEFKLKQA